jgi:hypothetical protein
VVAALYLLAFVAVLHQFRPLLGERGLLPVPAYLRSVRVRRAPTLFHLGYTDRRLVAVGVAGVAIAAALLVGLPQGTLLPGIVALPLTMAAWAALWVLYLSVVNVGQEFYSFGWESILLEAGFLAIFLGDQRTAPPTLVLVLFLWLTLRVELGAGLIKLRGDPCWRDLTCMDYHHETQPIPNPLSWYFHHLPRRFHRFEVLGNYVAQLAAPIALLLPQPLRALAGAAIIGTQSYLVVSGNYAWLNAVTIVSALPAIPDSVWRVVLPFPVAQFASGPGWFVVAVLALTVLVVVLSYRPVRNMLTPHQLMNYPFNAFHLVSSYGAFGSVTRERFEVIVEGTTEDDPADDDWRAYEFTGKPGDINRRPRQIAPYHLRLDWLMWFLPLWGTFPQTWFLAFVQKLLEHDRDVRRLLARDPFPDRPPLYIRARLFRYRYTTPAERRETGAWWSRTLVGTYLPPVTLGLARAGADA